MRFSASPRQLALLSLFAAGFSEASPFPKDDIHDVGYSFLRIRNCPAYCGADNQICCGSGEVCTTLKGDIATCVAEGAGYGEWTTTWTETRTYTSTYMTLWEPAPEPTEGVDCVPKNDQQEACGEICCAGWQTCAFKGQCSAKPGVGEGTTIVITSNGKVTTQYSAPYRVTGTTTVVTEGVPSNSASATETATAASSTATSDSDTIGAGGGTGGDLSPGAIAGIVIGTLAGVALLLLLCFCCIARGLWGLIFGKKKDKDRHDRVEVVEERYSRHGGSHAPSGYSRRDRHKGWFGGGGGGPSSVADRPSEKKKKSGNKWLGIGTAAATMLALLNVKKDKRPPPARKARSSRYTDSYYSYSDYTSPSSSSSGGRTAHTRRSRDNRSRSRPRSYYSRSASRR